MSLTITLQSNASEKNALTKSLTQIQKYSNAEMRSQTSIINPVFIVNATLADIVASNYCTIDEFGRSYFINNVKSLGNQLFELTCHVDVLTSFKTEILANSAIIRRNENKYNLYLDDNDFRIYQNPIIKTVSFSNGFTPNSSSYILAVAGAN